MAGLIVDAHVHVMPDRVRDDATRVAAADPWFATCHPPGRTMASITSLVAAMDADGIDVAVCLSWPFVEPAVCMEANDWLASAIRPHRDRLIGFGIVQPAHPGASAEVTRCARLGLRGIGELNADAQGWSLEDGGATGPVAAAAIEAGLPWTLHCSEPLGHAYAGKGTANPPRVAAMLERSPDLGLIAAHLGGGLPFYAHMPEVAVLCERLWFDTAAVPFLYRPSAYRSVIELCGRDRLLLGTDFPLLRIDRYRRGLGDAGLDAETTAAVLGGNAAAVLGLG